MTISRGRLSFRQFRHLAKTSNALRQSVAALLKVFTTHVSYDFFALAFSPGVSGPGRVPGALESWFASCPLRTGREKEMTGSQTAASEDVV